MAALLAVSLANAWMFRGDFRAAAGALFVRRDPQAENWERWARHYDRLFAMLASGERIGIQVEGHQASGYLLERTGGTMRGRSALLIRRQHPGVVLTIQQAAATEMLSSLDHDPDSIWQEMKDRLSAREISLGCDNDVSRLQRGGYLAFMRAIDTRPPGMKWPAVKALLGEK
ncbi:MAG: hypothetical protein ABIU54_13575 [Candidatus Eisenbacteria bacterium]